MAQKHSISTTATKQVLNIKIFIVTLLLIISHQLRSQTICDGLQAGYTYSFSQCDNNPWVLVFEDNFDGTSLNQTKWKTVTGINRDPYFQDQKAWHKTENISVANGILNIISNEETLLNQCCSIWYNGGMMNVCSDYQYSTGEISTCKNFSYGKFEARIKIPSGKGFWPAFWLYGDNPVYNEIDIFEFSDNNSNTQCTALHYDREGDGHDKDDVCDYKYNGPDYSLSYHIFTLIWDPYKIQWLVDGVLKRTDYKHYTLNRQATGCAITAFEPYILNEIYPQDPMKIILNTAIQVDNKAPDSSTPFPSQMEVDWVKYYKRSPCSDVNITNVSQFTLSNDNFNFLVGNNVAINCDYSVQTGQQLKIVAKNSVTLGPNFSVEAGAIFEVKIDQNICN